MDACARTLCAAEPSRTPRRSSKLSYTMASAMTADTDTSRPLARMCCFTSSLPRSVELLPVSSLPPFLGEGGAPDQSAVQRSEIPLDLSPSIVETQKFLMDLGKHASARPPHPARMAIRTRAELARNRFRLATSLHALVDSSRRHAVGHGWPTALGLVPFAKEQRLDPGALGIRYFEEVFGHRTRERVSAGSAGVLLRRAQRQYSDSKALAR